MTRPGRTLTIQDDGERRATVSAVVQKIGAPGTRQILTVRHLFGDCPAGHPVKADFETDDDGVVHQPCGTLARRAVGRDLALVALLGGTLAIPEPVDEGSIPRLLPADELDRVSGRACRFRGSQTGQWSNVTLTGPDEDGVFTGRLPHVPMFGDSGGPLYLVEDDEFLLVGMLVEHVNGLDRFLYPGRGMAELGVELWKNT